MKDIDLSKLRVATEAQGSEIMNLFSNESTLYIECLTKEFQIYHGKSAQDFEIYNSNCKLAITDIKPSALVIDLSATVCTKAIVTAAKMLEHFCLK